jgi:hypothetical protein
VIALITAVIGGGGILWAIVTVDVMSWLNAIPESEVKSAVQAMGSALLNDDHFKTTYAIAVAVCFVGALIRSRRRPTS